MILCKCGRRMRRSGHSLTTCQKCGPGRKVHERTCDQCGCTHKTSTPPRTVVKHGAFCSRQCRTQWNIEHKGVPCKECGEKFLRLRTTQTFCSMDCCRRNEQQKKNAKCKWCEQPFVKRDAGHVSCSDDCRCKPQRLKSWVRKAQRRYRGSLSKPGTWWFWYMCAARQKHELKGLTLEQRWKQRCCNMAAINRHRTPANRTECQPLTVNKTRTWAQVCKSMARAPKQISLEDKWKLKLHNKSRSQAQRMRRKTVMKLKS